MREVYHGVFILVFVGAGETNWRSLRYAPVGMTKFKMVEDLMVP
jgi:hypothetical protein